MKTEAVDERIFSEQEWQQLVDDLKLSGQQAHIVQHLFDGLSDKQIAMTMGISVPTVRTHFSRLFAKYEVEDRVDLLLLVFKAFREDCRNKHCPRLI